MDLPVRVSGSPFLTPTLPFFSISPSFSHLASLSLSLKSHTPVCQCLLWCESTLGKLERHMAPLSHCVLYACPACATLRPGKVCRNLCFIWERGEWLRGLGEEVTWQSMVTWLSYHILCHDFTSKTSLIPELSCVLTKAKTPGGPAHQCSCNEEQEGG